LLVVDIATTSLRFYEMKILLDMDGVLADFNLGFYQQWRTLYPNLPYLEPHEQNHRYVTVSYQEAFGQEIAERAVDLIKSRHFFTNLPEIPDAVEAVNSLLESGNDVFVCMGFTEGFPHLITEKTQWILTHLGERWKDRIIFSNDKHLIEAEILVDDNPNVEQGSWKLILYSQSHNLNSDKPSIVSWSEEIANDFSSFK